MAEPYAPPPADDGPMPKSDPLADADASLDKELESDSKMMAGEELAQALNKGDGAAIYDAFERLKELCEMYKPAPEGEDFLGGV